MSEHDENRIGKDVGTRGEKNSDEDAVTSKNRKCIMQKERELRIVPHSRKYFRLYPEKKGHVLADMCIEWAICRRLTNLIVGFFVTRTTMVRLASE